MFSLKQHKTSLARLKIVSLWTKINLHGLFLFFLPCGWVNDVCCASCFHGTVFNITCAHCTISYKPNYSGRCLAYGYVHKKMRQTKSTSLFVFLQFYFLLLNSHVHSGRKRRRKPVCLPLHLPRRRLWVLHLIWTQRRQDVVRNHQELWWWPQMGVLSWPRYGSMGWYCLCEGSSTVYISTRQQPRQ